VNELGQFTFPLIRIGAYEVSAESAGFRQTQTRAEVRTGETTNIRLLLEIGQVTETVMVTDAATALDTTNAQIQTSVTGQAVQDLPVARNRIYLF
jgi:hypothetical protein